VRKRLAVLSAAVALIFPAPAYAPYWEWGYGWLGPGVASGPCIWYWSQSVCSGWDYWNAVYTDKTNGGTILMGFENNARIRGHYVSGDTQHTTTTGDVGMGGYLLAHATYWSGDFSYLLVIGY
jgi:hypothetical protein